jgi:hypothetical protein
LRTEERFRISYFVITAIEVEVAGARSVVLYQVRQWCDEAFAGFKF